MKSMTDFIMEQEVVNPVEEFDDAKLVSEYMAVCAAFANVACICEYNDIATFCESNNIEKPLIIQEGEKLNAVFEAISGFFQKIADWFMGLIKGVSTVVKKAKLSEMIARLKSFDNKDEKLPDTKEYRATVFMANMTKYIVTAIRLFKDAFTATNNMYFGSNVISAAEERNKLYKDWSDIKDDLDIIIDTSKWKNSEGSSAKIGTAGFKNAEFTDIVTALGTQALKVSVSDFNDLIKVLEDVNKLDMPKEGDKLIKELKIDLDKIKQYNTTVDAAGNITAATKTTSEDKELTKIINEVASRLAKAYDKMAEGFVAVAEIATKDITVDKAKKKDYDEEVELAEKDKKRAKVRDL